MSDSGIASLARLPVVMEVPPEGSYLMLLRSAAATSASRLGFTIDEIEDLRIAVSEACSLILVDVDPAHPLRLVLSSEDDTISILASTRTLGKGVDTDSFPWMMLSALAGEVTSYLEDGVLAVRIVKQRGGDLG